MYVIRVVSRMEPTFCVDFKVCLFADRHASFLQTGSRCCDLASISCSALYQYLEWGFGDFFVGPFDDHTMFSLHLWHVRTVVHHFLGLAFYNLTLKKERELLKKIPFQNDIVLKIVLSWNVWIKSSTERQKAHSILASNFVTDNY